MEKQSKEHVNWMSVRVGGAERRMQYSMPSLPITISFDPWCCIMSSGLTSNMKYIIIKTTTTMLF